MAITLELTRPKAITTNTVNSVLSLGTVVETDTDEEESFFIPIMLESIDPSFFTIADCTTTNGSAEITTINDGFTKVKVGDEISGIGISSTSTVTAKANANSITIDNNATASGSVALTFDPPSVTPTVYALKITHSKAGSVFGVNASLYIYDGTEDATGTEDNASKIAKLVSNDGQPVQINMDTFLTNLRIPQTT